MSASPVVPGLYRHHKGGAYRVIGVARHSETREQLVVYQALYGDMGLWVRPASMFFQEVEAAGAIVPRFVLEKADAAPKNP